MAIGVPTPQLDQAYICFYKAKLVTVQLAEIENSVYRLANAIKDPEPGKCSEEHYYPRL